MRILHLTTFLQGGAGRIIAALAVAQQRAGHDVTVVADGGGEDGYASYPEYLATIAEAGVRYATVCSTFKRDLFLNVQAARQLRLIAGASGPDVVHTHAAIPTLVARVALGSAPARLVQTMHGWGIGKTPEQAETDLTLLASADLLVTPSAAAREGLRGLGFAAPVEVVPYGLDPAPPARPVDADDARLIARLRAGGAAIALCIGTIGARKNQALLVEALPALPEVAAVFVGDGDVSSLSTLAAARGVADRVHVLGYREDARRFLTSADVFVLPSRNEGLPIAVIEALRAGVPVVASAIAEIAEIVDDGHTGYLVPPDDVAALARAVRQAVGPAGRAALGEAGRAVFAARYGLGRMTAAYERLYLAQQH